MEMEVQHVSTRGCGRRVDRGTCVIPLVFQSSSPPSGLESMTVIALRPLRADDTNAKSGYGVDEVKSLQCLSAPFVAGCWPCLAARLVRHFQYKFGQTFRTRSNTVKVGTIYFLHHSCRLLCWNVLHYCYLDVKVELD